MTTGRESLNAARRSGRLVLLKLGELPGVPGDLQHVWLVYCMGEAQDVLVITDDGDQELRLEYQTPMEQEAVRVARIYADPPPGLSAVSDLADALNAADNTLRLAREHDRVHVDIERYSDLIEAVRRAIG